MTSKITEFKGEYDFLSNFYERPIKYFDMDFRTAEHMFNALKTNDITEAIHVMSAPTPAIAKQRGQKVTLKPNWDETERFKAMRRTVGVKFLTDPELMQRLLDTGDAVLEEGNYHHDNTWGNCYCGKWTCKGIGNNNLGIILMELRDDIRKWL